MITKSTYIYSDKGLRSAIKYILNEEKTTIPGSGASTVLSYKCRHRKEKTVLDFSLFFEEGRKRSVVRDSRELYGVHYILSFAIEDWHSGRVTIDLAKEIAVKFIERLTGGNFKNGGGYQYVLAVHLDKPHLHVHVILNPVVLDTLDRKNYLNMQHPAALFAKRKKVKDQLVKEYGLINAEKVGAYRKELKEFEREQREIERELEGELEEIKKLDG